MYLAFFNNTQCKERKWNLQGAYYFLNIMIVLLSVQHYYIILLSIYLSLSMIHLKPLKIYHRYSNYRLRYKNFFENFFYSISICCYPNMLFILQKMVKNVNNKTWLFFSHVAKIIFILWFLKIQLFSHSKLFQLLKSDYAKQN